jgi:hypothetical protein
MPNAYIHRFRPHHQYFSFYPYYLPSYYSNYYPRHYNRYYEPVNYVTVKHGPVKVEDTTIDLFNFKNFAKLVFFIVVFMFIMQKLFKVKL